jgi:GNAT superfamily N-acetyltransferase
VVPLQRPVKATESLRIRRATLADLDAAVRLFGQLNDLERPWRIFAPSADPLEQAMRRYRRLIRGKKGIVVLAEAKGSPVGLGVAEVVTPSSYSTEQAVELSNVYVDHAYRGLGLGSAIVKELLAFTHRKRIPKLVLRVFAPNAAAAEFWMHFGFEPRLIQFVALSDRVSAEASRTRKHV